MRSQDFLICCQRVYYFMHFLVTLTLKSQLLSLFPITRCIKTSSIKLSRTRGIIYHFYTTVAGCTIFVSGSGYESALSALQYIKAAFISIAVSVDRLKISLRIGIRAILIPQRRYKTMLQEISRCSYHQMNPLLFITYLCKTNLEYI